MNFLNTNKVLYHPDRFSEWQETGDCTAPVTIKIDLTNVCNHDCPGCIDFDLIVNDNNQLKLEVFEELLPELNDMGVKGVNYTGGGEPTTHKKFGDIIKRTNENNLEVGLITNGSRFHKQPMEEILKMFTWIRVSFDSYDQETHTRTHGPSARFGEMVSNLELLVKIKKEQNLDSTIGMGFITNQHADMDRNLYKFVEIAKNIGVDYVQLRPSFGTMFDYDSISYKEWTEIFDKAKAYETDSFKVFIDRGKFEKILSGNTERNYCTCHAQAFKSTTITATGAVYVCCSLTGRQEGFIGNIKTESFSEIWNGEKRKKTLADLNVKLCPRLCVGDNLNEFLEDFKNNEPNHRNFL